MARHVRKGDQVIVTAGDDRGRQGRVLRVLPGKEKAVVEGLNLRIKHMKPTQENQQGGKVQREGPIHLSNLSPIAEGKPTRVRFQTRADGAKVRVAARNGQQIGQEIKKARR